MESDFESICPHHQAEINMICIGHDCPDFELCPECNHKEGCPGDLICPAQLRKSLFTLQIILSEHNSKHRKCTALINSYSDRIKSVYLRKATIRFNRMRTAFRQQSGLASFNTIRADLRRALDKNNSEPLSDLKRRIVTILTRLRQCVSQLKQSDPFDLANLEANLKKYCNRF